MSTKSENLVKDKIKSYLAGNIEQMLQDIDSLDDAGERIKLRMKLLEYVTPKQQAVKAEQTKTQSAIDFLLDQEAGLAE